MKKRNIVWLCASAIMIIAILPVAACTPAAEGVMPQVISTNPASNAQNVATNTLVTATFNEGMNASTINATTFTLTQASKPVSGKVTYSGTKATFTPDVNLEMCATYTARITTGAKDAAGNALASDYVWNFSTSCATGTGPRVVGSAAARAGGYGAGGVWGGGGGNPGAFTTSPTIVSTNPVANAGGCVAVGGQITATFSEIMDATSINSTTFTLVQGNTPIPGVVSYVGITAFFTPLNPLSPGATYTATINTGARDQSGSPLVNPFIWTFTACGPAPVAPRVLSTIPINNDLTCLPINSSISAIFSKPMLASSLVGAFTLVQTAGSVPVPGTVFYSGVTAVFTPGTNLLLNTSYTATISTAAKDAASGLHLATPTVWTFMTCNAPPDTTHPTLIATIPADGATNVALNTAITATFDKAMNPLTLNSTTFTVEDMTTSTFLTATSIITVGAISVFTPNANLIVGHNYQANITTGAQDLAGNALVAGVAPNPWTFNTLAAPPIGPLLPPLLTAGNYRILAESAITTTGSPASAITGDMGISPNFAASITGFTLTLVGQYSTAPNVSGRVYAADYASPTPANLTLATTAMTNAYTQTQNIIIPAPVVNPGASGELAGLSLVPGVYKFDTSQPNVTLHGNLHLAAVGANDTWIFQIPGTFTVFPGSNVIMDAPGQAKNVYWQVAGATQIQSSAGTPTTFNGVILSASGIAIGDHAIMHGQELSQTAVTLISDQVGP